MEARFAVIFTSVRTEGDNGYGAMAEELERRMKEQPGFVSMDSVRGPDGAGITVCYWSSMEAIEAWKALPIHREAQARGRAEWYQRYAVRVCRVERDYGFPGSD